MKIKTYNLEGKETGVVEVSDKVFAVKIKPEVVHEVFILQTSNAREPWAHTKDRSDVSGGGKKPWQQKGTGRARHGSIRSPLWKGGGVTFGPLSSRNYTKKINKKVRKLALRMCLSDRVKDGVLIVVENFDFSDIKTKLFSSFIGKLPVKRNSHLVLTNGKNENIMRVTNNLPKIDTMIATELNVKDILNKQMVIISKEALKKLEEILIK